MHDRISDDVTRRPYFPFYPQYWIADPRIQLLSAEGRGALIQLMAYAWIGTPPCTLPDRDEDLAALSGLAERWPLYSRQLRAQFVTTECGLLHPSLAQHFERMIEKAEARSRAGKKGNQVRWGDRDAIAARSHEDVDQD